MNLNNASATELQQLRSQLLDNLEAFKAKNLSLDLTRGKPSSEQLALSDSMQAINLGDFKDGGVDTRNYGGIYGTESARKLGAQMLDVSPEEVLVGGNSSLTLMYQSVLFAWLFGPGNSTPWKDEPSVKFICPSPGYDRHFAICEEFGIEMIPVSINENGPDMDEVEALVKNDPAIRGIWCVPKYSNPTGCIYSDETVERIAALGKTAHAGFRIFWDNAYAVHDLGSSPARLHSLMQAAKEQQTADSIYMYCSTSKITFAGSGISFFAASSDNLASFSKHLGISTIGPDKVNQLRHTGFFKNIDDVHAHMQLHAALLKPRFAAVIDALKRDLGTTGEFGEWGEPEGGYFVSFDTRQGLADKVVQLTGEAGVKLTPAGATFPYGKDPENKNIRLAPSFASVEDIETAMAIFTTCVRLATVESLLN